MNIPPPLSTLSPSPDHHVTLHDVADAAQVSYQTVSRVVNRSPHVAETTRTRVLAAIAALGYHPNQAARSLVTRRSHTFEAILFGAHHYGPSQMVAAAERAARAVGYRLVIQHLTAMTAEELRAAIGSPAQRAVDGLIIVAPVIGVGDEELRALCGVPFVLMDARPDTALPSVLIDQQRGGWLAAEHLLDLGHTRLAAISGPRNWHGAVARWQGWQAAAQARGIASLPTEEGDWTAQGGYEAARRLLAGNGYFTGLVVGNDQMALGALRALEEAGKHVPDDVSVVGFDDVPEAAWYSPALTTVRQEFGTLGTAAVETLMRQIALDDGNEENVSLLRVFDAALIVRASTA